MLVADKITAHRNFEAYYEQLNQAARPSTGLGLTDPSTALRTGEDLGNKIVAAVKNWTENRAIFEELDYYEEEGEVLGKHPKLWKLAIERDVRALGDLQVVRRLHTVRANVSRDRKKLKKLKGSAKEKFEHTFTRLLLEKELLEKRYNGQK